MKFHPQLPGVAILGLALASLAGCATPIADAYKETRVASPPHEVISLSIAGAEMVVLNPLLYYPLELVGIADFDLVWREDEDAPRPPLREDEMSPFADSLLEESYDRDAADPFLDDPPPAENPDPGEVEEDEEEGTES